MKPTVPVIVGAALALGVLAGCAGGERAAGSAAATSTVDLPPSYRFEPADITVPAGTTVTWTNNDRFTHSVAFSDPPLPEEPLLMKPGEDTEVTFDSTGTFPYVCHLHPQNMKGTVTVTP